MHIYTPAAAMGNCASAEQTSAVQAFYAEGGGIPWQAQQRGGLDMSEELIASALAPEQAVGANGDAFDDVWTAMTAWQNATILVMKGGNVLETKSGINSGVPSERSAFFNLGDEHPFSGHLRPDLVSSIYAFELPGDGGRTTRSVAFFGQEGESIFYAAMAGEDPEVGPTDEEIAQFNAVKDVIASKPALCTGM